MLPRDLLIRSDAGENPPCRVFGPCVGRLFTEAFTGVNNREVDSVHRGFIESVLLLRCIIDSEVR